MPLSECCINIDSSGQELIDHGTGAFPVACYLDDFRIMDVPWHWHPEWEAVRIIKGSCTVAIGSQKTTLHAGQGFFINSGILHSCWDPDASGCVFHSIVFHPRLISGSTDSAIHLNYILPMMDNSALDLMILSPSLPWQQEALNTIEIAWQACRQAKSGYEFVVRNALSSLILILWDHLPPDQSVSEKRTQRETNRIKTMLSYIHKNFHQSLSVRQIASTVSVSESECLRCFRTAIGVTPIQYLKHYRLQQAATLLISTDKKITDIAICCGFQDVSYFTKSFREQMQYTPAEYRKTEHRSK